MALYVFPISIGKTLNLGWDMFVAYIFPPPAIEDMACMLITEWYLKNMILFEFQDNELNITASISTYTLQSIFVK